MTKTKMTFAEIMEWEDNFNGCLMCEKEKPTPRSSPAFEKLCEECYMELVEGAHKTNELPAHRPTEWEAREGYEGAE